jgi:hypothetical protein
MEPGGAPSELSFHQQGVSSSFDHRAKGKGTKRGAFAVLLTRIFPLCAGTTELASNVPNLQSVDADAR